MYNIAASFARVADGEWMRSCESVRRFSAAVGPLGQWRALSEGGWQGPVPPDLPDAARAARRTTVLVAANQTEMDPPTSPSQPRS